MWSFPQPFFCLIDVDPFDQVIDILKVVVKGLAVHPALLLLMSAMVILFSGLCSSSSFSAEARARFVICDMALLLSPVPSAHVRGSGQLELTGVELIVASLLVQQLLVIALLLGSRHAR